MSAEYTQHGYVGGSKIHYTNGTHTLCGTGTQSVLTSRRDNTGVRATKEAVTCKKCLSHAAKASVVVIEPSHQEPNTTSSVNVGGFVRSTLIGTVVGFVVRIGYFGTVKNKRLGAVVRMASGYEQVVFIEHIDVISPHDALDALQVEV